MPDPCNDRVMKSVPAPPNKYLTLDRVFPAEGGAVNVDLVEQYLYEGGRLSKECLLELTFRSRQVLMQEQNLLRVDGRVVIIGDIHG